MAIITSAERTVLHRNHAMTTCAHAVPQQDATPLLGRLFRNVSIAGLAGVALSGLVTFLPDLPDAATVQWSCALAGSALGAVLAFLPKGGSQTGHAG